MRGRNKSSDRESDGIGKQKEKDNNEIVWEGERRRERESGRERMGEQSRERGERGGERERRGAATVICPSNAEAEAEWRLALNQNSLQKKNT